MLGADSLRHALNVLGAILADREHSIEVWVKEQDAGVEFKQFVDAVIEHLEDARD